MEMIRSTREDTGAYTRNRRPFPHSNDVFLVHAGHMTLEEVMQYPEYPTAQRMGKALENFQDGRRVILELLNKTDQSSPILQANLDLKQLQFAIQKICCSFSSFNWLEEEEFPISKTISLIQYYISKYPGNVLAEFVYFILQTFVRNSTDKNANIVETRDVRSWLLDIAQKLETSKTSMKENELQNNILSSVFYRLGTEFYSLNQLERSVGAFQRCLELDTHIYQSNAIFALGYAYRNIKPKKALGFLKQYLEKAPGCHEQYPHALYTVGTIYFNHFRDHERALEYYERAKLAETKRLPFLPSVCCDPKTVLETIVNLDRDLLKHDLIAINWKVFSALIVFVSTVLYVIIKTR